MSERVQCRVATLWQPWATAIAMGLKTIETRNWSTRYRGLLGIHAGKRWDKDAAVFLPPAVVERARGECGVLLAVATLADVVRYETMTAWKEAAAAHLCPMEFWNPEKHGWILKNLRRVKPVPVMGAMGLWRFVGDVEYLEGA